MTRWRDEEDLLRAIVQTGCEIGSFWRTYLSLLLCQSLGQALEALPVMLVICNV